jgi:diguanylate cyclase (GGDEF)-like protein/PAS domain S-box-containing protein
MSKQHGAAPAHPTGSSPPPLAPGAQHLLELADATPHVVWIGDAHGNILYVNKAANWPVNEILGDSWLEALHPDDVPGTRERWQACVKSGERFTTHYRILNLPQREYRWYFVTATRSVTPDGQAFWYGTCTDVEDAMRAHEQLRLQQAALEACASPIAIIGSGDDYPLKFLNAAFEQVTGYSAQEIAREGLSVLWRHAASQRGLAQLCADHGARRQGRAVLELCRRDGAPLWVDVSFSPVPDGDGVVRHFVVAMSDITAAKRYEAELEHQARYDALTGLANRQFLQQSAPHLMERAEPGTVYIAYLALDRFRALNEMLGHDAGDEALRAMAGRMRALLRPGDLAARVGAAEFAILFAASAGETEALVAALREAVARPMLLAGHEYALTCSVGIASACPDSRSAEILLQHAHQAMLRAKAGASGVQYFVAEMNQQALERLQLQTDLRHALARGELALHYQPQVDLDTGRVAGMEALLRWQHPQLGPVSPAVFIPLAEETGLIHEIGAWALRAACRQNKAWQDAGLAPLRVAVNLSGKEFYRPDLAATVAAALRESGLDGRWLDLELTEGLVTADIGHAVSILHQLKQLGVSLSIDDFGTGYSSLSYLKNFPIDVLKIDQSFVRNIATDPADAAIAGTIVTLGRSLGLSVIAEGVETAEQLHCLRRCGCDQIQGYLFSRPLPPGAFEQLLRDDRSLALAGQE